MTKWNKKFVNIFVEDISERNKNQPDGLFKKLKNNHPKINHTTEVKPEKFPDTNIIPEHDRILQLNCFITKESYQFDSLQKFWRGIKGMLTNSYLNTIAYIASNPISEIPIIKFKFLIYLLAVSLKILNTKLTVMMIIS